MGDNHDTRDAHAGATDRIKRAEAFPLQNPIQIVSDKLDWKLGDGPREECQQAEERKLAYLSTYVPDRDEPEVLSLAAMAVSMQDACNPAAVAGELSAAILQLTNMGEDGKLPRGTKRTAEHPVVRLLVYKLVTMAYGGDADGAFLTATPTGEMLRWAWEWCTEARERSEDGN